MAVIVSLVGQQPIPNLLPIRHLKPESILLVYSAFTKPTADKLINLVEDDLDVWPLRVDPYNINEILSVLVQEITRKNIDPRELIFNITGGTKPMSLAAYLVAAHFNSDFVYLQSEGKQSRLYSYAFDNEEPRLIQDGLLPGLITVQDYLRAYIDDYNLTGFAKDAPGGLFERDIFRVLEPGVDEILVGVKLLGALDVDFVIRCDNQVGIVEAKTGKGMKKGLDQLNTAGGQQYLGTYTQKFLVSDQAWGHTRSNLKELAEARRITVIELPSHSQTGQISPAEATKLQVTVCGALGRILEP